MSFECQDTAGQYQRRQSKDNPYGPAVSRFFFPVFGLDPGVVSGRCRAFSGAVLPEAVGTFAVEAVGQRCLGRFGLLAPAFAVAPFPDLRQQRRLPGRAVRRLVRVVYLHVAFGVQAALEFARQPRLDPRLQKPVSLLPVPCLPLCRRVQRQGRFLRVRNLALAHRFLWRGAARAQQDKRQHEGRY